MIFFKQKQINPVDFFIEDFVDIHSHLLPGIDDGAKDLDHSVSLILKMKSYGIKNFITTPHILGDLYPNTPKIITSKLKDLKTELNKRNIKDISIRAAAEYMMDEKFSELLQGKNLLTLKDNYILVEMSYLSAPINLFDILFEIQLKEYKPVLAHPERYIFYHNNINNYNKLKTAGCLFQLNLLSLTEHYGKNVQKISNKLLDQNMYDFVGTDTHHINHLNMLKNICTKKALKKIEHLLHNNKKFI
ncbi:tyrosine-protein phosphatase [Polaribacter sp. Asnod1-A03]|uniref:tyrosine-protein phosphatase n=1 Tax=Polaribacter sp. Asnod1-A03 TaxID=3160581 RepID=UPI003869A06B